MLSEDCLDVKTEVLVCHNDQYTERYSVCCLKDRVSSIHPSF
jgi:hypothetical protein